MGTSPGRTLTLRGVILLCAIVLLLFWGLCMGVPSFVHHKTEAAKEAMAKAQVKYFSAGLELFRMDIGRFPTTQEGLAALTQAPVGVRNWRAGGYLHEPAGPDPWGHAFVYRSPGEHGAPFYLASLGSDGAPGGEGDAADIVSGD